MVFFVFCFSVFIWGKLAFLWLAISNLFVRCELSLNLPRECYGLHVDSDFPTSKNLKIISIIVYIRAKLYLLYSKPWRTKSALYKTFILFSYITYFGFMWLNQYFLENGSVKTAMVINWCLLVIFVWIKPSWYQLPWFFFCKRTINIKHVKIKENKLPLYIRPLESFFSHQDQLAFKFS